jgi:branched-chain amino acid transport system ATP-binding protein
MLTLTTVEVVYDGVVLVLRGLSLRVPEGRIVALLGPNGAGKSTVLKSISGLLAGERGEVRAGRIELRGERVDGLPADEMVKRGVFHVIEGRRVFEDLTVDENLTLGGHTRKDRGALKADRELCFDYFPRLRDLRRATAGYLSGGEQQMLAIGRALMARPSLVLLDEPSLGLAPLAVESIFRIVKRINEERRTTFLLVEQNARMALSVADHAHVIESGRVVLEGTADELRASPRVREAYFGA